MTRLVFGCMTGTSLDGIDVAAVAVEGRGLTMRAEIVASNTASFEGVAADLRAYAEGAAMTACQATELRREYSLRVADALCSLQTRSPDLACVHGQTVYHAPPLSWQLLSPAIIAHAVGCPVLSDLRSADIAAGGQGAPITPLADAVLFGDPEVARCIVNLGGFVNITQLPPKPFENTGMIQGRDVCPCNQALDLVARIGFNAPFDVGGHRAITATPDDGLVASLVETSLQNASSRSLGTHDSWSALLIKALDLGMDAGSVARSVSSAVARLINDSMTTDATEIILAGGGALNAALFEDIQTTCESRVVLSDTLGVDASVRESAAMAVLGALTMDGVPITLSQITGCTTPAPLAGTITLHRRSSDS